MEALKLICFIKFPILILTVLKHRSYHTLRSDKYSETPLVLEIPQYTKSYTPTQ